MTEKRIRVQFDLTPEQVAHLDQLVQRSGLQTRAELFRAAFAAFEYLTDQAGEGWVVEARKGEAVERLMPLVSVAR